MFYNIVMSEHGSSPEHLHSLAIPELAYEWLMGEYRHSAAKYGTNQSDKLRTQAFLSQGTPSGDMSRYWGSLQQYPDDAYMHRAQYAAKVANGGRMLWTTLRAFDWEHDTRAAEQSAELIKQHIATGAYRDAKRYIGKVDFYETPMGLGLAHLGALVERHGFEQRFRLAELNRAEDIMYDAADVMALQFEDTLEHTGSLPKPGLSSGNIEPWPRQD